MKPSIIEAVKEYFEECPELGKLSKVKVDFLSSDVGSYSVEETPATPVVKNFVDGSRECQFLFVFASRSFYATDTNRQNIDNLHLLENIREWLEENNRNNQFPDLGENRQVESIEVTTGGYLFGINDSGRHARYQIQCKLTYLER